MCLGALGVASRTFASLIPPTASRRAPPAIKRGCLGSSKQSPTRAWRTSYSLLAEKMFYQNLDADGDQDDAAEDLGAAVETAADLLADEQAHE